MSNTTQERLALLADEEMKNRRRAGLLRIVFVSFLRNRTALFGVFIILVVID